MKKSLSLWALLTLVLIITSSIAISFFYMSSLKQSYQSIQQNEKTLLKSTAQFLKEDPNINDALKAKQSNQQLQTFVQKMTKQFHLDYVVLMDMNGIRLTHPDPSKIGKHFKGGDEHLVFHGRESFSTAKGTLGQSLRYFAPVFDDKKQQIGAIAVGIKLTTLEELSQKQANTYGKVLIINIAVSLSITAILALLLKKELHDLEPKEIFQLLEERNAMLDNTQAAVLVLNNRHEIKHFNYAAASLFEALKQPSTDVKKIVDLLPYLENKQFETSDEQLLRFQGKDYLLTISPIIVKNNQRGHIVFLKDASKTLFTQNQLETTTAYAKALQAQNHHFMNQLHVIYGLLDTQYYDELKWYLYQLLEPGQDTLSQLSLLIKDPLLASFFVGEKEKFSEEQIVLNITILDDIDTFSNETYLNNFMLIQHYIHNRLIANISATYLNLEVLIEGDKIVSELTLPPRTDKPLDLETIFSTPYFHQLIQDSQVTFQINHDQEKSQLIFISPY
ncbi:sensor histidine kinase [Streptococcus jiangjianxini]|uniref:sensor histidine kinase n=1 Tax=Streptococcus jiangjianxini TaxID=3161189 RepID=UPI0032ED34CA